MARRLFSFDYLIERLSEAAMVAAAWAVAVVRAAALAVA